MNTMYYEYRAFYKGRQSFAEFKIDKQLVDMNEYRVVRQLAEWDYNFDGVPVARVDKKINDTWQPRVWPVPSPERNMRMISGFDDLPNGINNLQVWP